MHAASIVQNLKLKSPRKPSLQSSRPKSVINKLSVAPLRKSLEKCKVLKFAATESNDLSISKRTLEEKIIETMLKIKNLKGISTELKNKEHQIAYLTKMLENSENELKPLRKEFHESEKQLLETYELKISSNDKSLSHLSIISKDKISTSRKFEEKLLERRSISREKSEKSIKVSIFSDPNSPYLSKSILSLVSSKKKISPKISLESLLSRKYIKLHKNKNKRESAREIDIKKKLNNLETKIRCLLLFLSENK